MEPEASSIENIEIKAVAIDLNWEAKIANQESVSLDDLKFIFSQAEKRLDDGIKNYDATTAKSITFITLTATLLTALTAFFFVNFDPAGVFSPKLCAVLACCAYAFYVLYHFISIVLPKNYQPIGSFPQHLYTDELFTDEMMEKTKAGITYSTLFLYTTEFESYNKRIKENADVNSSRLIAFNKAAKQICYLPAIGVVSYFVFLLFSLF